MYDIKTKPIQKHHTLGKNLPSDYKKKKLIDLEDAEPFKIKKKYQNYQSLLIDGTFYDIAFIKDFKSFTEWHKDLFKI
jgi:hypothetical protein